MGRLSIPMTAHPFLSGRVPDYLHDLQPARDGALVEMEAIASERGFPIIGPQVGAMLFALTRATGARRIFEMGSGFGYSAVWFARALPADGHIWCTEGDPGNVQTAKDFLRRDGILDKVTLQVGNALDLIIDTEGDFDIIFNDVDKEDYPVVFDLAFPRLKQGGLLISDNTLWSGRAAADRSEDAATKGIQEYNRKAFSTEGALSFLAPIRDGVTVTLKL